MRTISYEIDIFLDHKESHIVIGKHPDALVFTLLTSISYHCYSCLQLPGKIYSSSSPIVFYLFITLSLNLPRSLWFDLGTSRIIFLRSPALGSEQAGTQKVYSFKEPDHVVVLLLLLLLLFLSLIELGFVI